MDNVELHNELQALRDLRDLLEPSQNWTQNFFAADGKGNSVDEHSSIAQCWCLWGGLRRITRLLDFPVYKSSFMRLSRLARKRGFDGLPSFNDSSRHIDVLELIDEAIAEVIKEVTAQ